MPPKRALDVSGAPRRELANKIDTLCSDFEIRVGTTDVATASLNRERPLALSKSVFLRHT